MVVPTHASAKSPHMIIFAATAAVSSFIQVVINEQPASLAATVSPSIATSWSMLCCLGGLSIIVGAFMKNPAPALAVEATGHFAVGIGYLAYSIALVYHITATWYASTTFWWCVAFVLASGIRWFIIHRVISKARRKVALREGAWKHGD